MLFLSIVHHYFLWHYSLGFAQLLHVWYNFVWFIVHFFSLPQLLRSWFSPWKRMVEGRGQAWDLEDLAGYIVVGIISRIIGALMRTVVMAIGLVALIVTLAAGAVAVAFWVAAPVVIIALLGFGITLLASAPFNMNLL